MMDIALYITTYIDVIYYTNLLFDSNNTMIERQMGVSNLFF